MSVFRELQIGDHVAVGQDGKFVLAETPAVGTLNLKGAVGIVVRRADHAAGVAEIVLYNSHSLGGGAVSRHHDRMVLQVEKYPEVRDAWLSADVKNIAADVRDHGHYSDMVVLADALLDAGCDDATVLDSCRAGQGWVLEKILEKKGAR